MQTNIIENIFFSLRLALHVCTFLIWKGNKERANAIACGAALARVEKTDFLQPMLIGEVAKVHAELSYASKHSVEVTAYVWAENLRNGVKRLTNQ